MHKFYDDTEFLSREFSILEAGASRAETLRDANARRHLKEGFDRRVHMIQESRIFMRETIPPERTKALAVHEVTRLSVHLNAYYLNLSGALDNLAWGLHYERGLLGEFSEASGHQRRSCTLFGRKFVQAVREEAPALADSLSEYAAWGAELKQLRDPSAHRIPLYVPPGVITDEGTLEEFRRLDSLAAGTSEERGGRRRVELLERARSLARCQPIFCTSEPGHLGRWSIPDQVARDHEAFLSVSEKVLSNLYCTKSAV